VLAVCDDESVIGAPFYVMQEVQGIVITDSMPEALDTPEQRGRVADELIDSLVELHQTAPGPQCEIHVHDLGGAVARVGENETAFSGRDQRYVLNIVNGWQDPADDEANMAWIRDVGARLDEFCTGAVYSNFMASEGEERTKAAYGEKLPRLQALKRAWDPDNVFHRNQNVKP